MNGKRVEGEIMDVLVHDNLFKIQQTQYYYFSWFLKTSPANLIFSFK